MSSANRVPRLRELALVVVLAGVLIGLVGMHHLVVTDGAAPVAAGAGSVALSVDHDPAGEAPAQSGQDGHEGGLLHLCMAVLAVVVTLAIAVALGFWWLLVAAVARLATSSGRRRTNSRGPPISVPRRLALLCVLRT